MPRLIQTPLCVLLAGLLAGSLVVQPGRVMAEDKLLWLERSDNLKDWSTLPFDGVPLQDGMLRVPDAPNGEYYRVRLMRASDIARKKLEIFARSDGSDRSLYPSVADYADLGVVGATQAYLEGINRQVLRRGYDAVDTTEKLQWLVDEVREGVYDIYVSSQSGNDANDGSSSAKAFATLARAEAAALALGDGVTIRLAAGSVWRESLDLAKLSNVVIGGGLATIDCADVVEGLTPHPTLANVWQVSWPLVKGSAPATSYEVLCAEGPTADAVTLLTDVRSSNVNNNQLQVSSTPGSYYFDKTNEVLYLHPRNSADPATSGQTFTATRRIYALRTGANANVDGVLTRMNGHNDGSLIVGANSNVRRSVCQAGHKHNLFLSASGQPLIEDVVLVEAREAEGPGGGSMVVFYGRDPNDCEVTVNRLVAVGSLDGTSRINATVAYGHGGSSSDALRAVRVEGLLTDLHAYPFSAATRLLDVRGAHFERFGTLPQLVVAGTVYSGHETQIRYTTGRHTIPITNRPAGYTYALRDSAFFWASDGSFMQMTGNNITALTMENVSLCTLSGAKLSPGSSPMASITQNYCIIMGAHVVGSYVAIKQTGVPYTGDHNIYWRGWGNSSGVFFGSADGVNISSLQAWQTATGQDLNSVTLATGDQAAGHPNAFWLAWAQAAPGSNLANIGPAQGDFRINPLARVYTASGTALIGKFPDGVPITAAGAQATWDFSTRSVVSGPPQRWPAMPDTLEEAKSYVTQPESWQW